MGQVVSLFEHEELALARRRWRRRHEVGGPPPGSFAHAVAECRPCKKCKGPRSYSRRSLCDSCDPHYRVVAEFLENEKEEKSMSTEVDVTAKAEKGTMVKRCDPLKVTIIGLDTSHKAGEHPLWDSRINLPINEGMVQHIMVHGVQQPIIVREDGEELEVIEGRQRVRACREANVRLGAAGGKLLKIPYLVKKGADDKTAMRLMISSNTIRTQDAAFANAIKAKGLVDAGDTEEEVALEFGCSAQTIRIWVKILACDSSVLDALKSGALKMSAARELASLPREKQRELLAGLIANPPAPADEVDGEEVDDDREGREVTANDVRRAKKRDGEAESDGDGDGEERGPRHMSDAPNKTLLKRLQRELADKDSAIHLKAELGEQAIAMLDWVLGECKATKVEGLPAAVRYINKLYAKKTKKAE